MTTSQINTMLLLIVEMERDQGPGF